MDEIREPAVAGLFYPKNEKTLTADIHQFLKQAEDYQHLPIPKAIIAPHAGYIYSGSIAASAYACLQNQEAIDTIRRVVLLGPAHQYFVEGLATSGADFFKTPLGLVPLDRKSIESALQFPFVKSIDEAHRMEHSLEVHLPFLQLILKEFSLVPFAVGDVDPMNIAKVLERVWGGKETLIVISSDLSHYYDVATARQLDNQTAQAILRLDPTAIHHEQACGRLSIQGLLMVAAHKKLKPFLIDLRNSGDTAGPKDQVVGYGAFHFIEE
jgi:MEMO1 family protein